jgi:membrane-associated PAP2 superfamily phosphatase
MDLTFELIGNVAVWMFISELIILAIFEKSGKQFKIRFKRLTQNLNPYIKKYKYILTSLLIFLVVGIIQSQTNFVELLLVKFIGNAFLLYLMAFSFDFIIVVVY